MTKSTLPPFQTKAVAQLPPGSTGHGGTEQHALVGDLIGWFNRNARPLPWRQTTDPYAIWISEVMLQQTQVATVVPYWKRWMEHFPDVTALARAPIERVLKLWEGLGYYTRARHLHAAANRIADNHLGTFPEGYDAILALPGVGRYTAGAICSIAFNQPTPILDGNVIRVLSRLYAIRGNISSAQMKDRLWRQSHGLVETAARQGQSHTRACSALNQALMELGATICRPQAPECGACPVQKHCIARRTGLVAKIPYKKKRPAITARRFIAFVVSRGNRVLLEQRPNGVVNAGLWEFPNVEVNGSAEGITGLANACLGWTPAALESLGQIDHSITRFRIRLEAYQGQAHQGPLPERPTGRWCTWKEVEQLALPSAHRKIVGLRARVTAQSSGPRKRRAGAYASLANRSPSAEGLGENRRARRSW